MQSKTYKSVCYESAEKILADLLEQGAGEWPEGSLGFLYCDSHIDYESLVVGLQNVLSFPVVGGTTMGIPFDNGQGNDVSVMLMVLRKEGMRFSVTVSEPLAGSLQAGHMKVAYALGNERLGLTPKLVMVFLPLLSGPLASDSINDIFSCAGDTPVFGCTCTSDLINTRAATFSCGKIYTDRMILLMLGGDIQPVCASCCQVSPVVEYAPVVTRTQGNEVFTVDGKTFCDYLADIGINPENRVRGVDALMQYGPTPVVVETAEGDETDVPEVRCVSCTDLQRQSVTFSAPVPEGAKIHMSILRKQDVIDSVQQCLEKLEDRMRPARETGYVFSAFFCVTSVARYFVQAGGTDMERQYLSSHAPQDCAPIGLYAFCEIGPVYSKNDGSIRNRAHSTSITMCSL